MRNLFFPVITLLLLSSCQQPLPEKKEIPFDPSAQRSFIGANYAVMSQAVSNHDSTQLASFYTTDARLCPDNGSFVVGRDAIKNWYGQQFAFLRDMQFITISLEGTREVLYETGISTVKIQAGDSSLVQSVKYTHVWRMQPDSTYQIAVDSWNNLPAEDEHDGD